MAGATAVPYELDELLARQSGVVTLAVAMSLLGRGTVRWRLERGRWQQPRPGVVVTHSGPVGRTQALWVDVLCAGGDAVLAGLTAAICDGLRGFEPETTHVLVPWGRTVARREGIVVRRSRHLGTADVHPIRLPPRTRLPRSLIDAAVWAANNDRARAILAAGVQQRLVRVGDLHDVIDRLPSVPRRKLLRHTLADIAGGAEALSELDFVHLLRRFGLPEPTRQVVRRDRHGRRRWLDAYFDPWGVVVEIDGCWHMEAQAWWADMDRDNQLTIAGERVLRFPSFALREEQERVAHQIAAALRSAGWPG